MTSPQVPARAPLTIVLTSYNYGHYIGEAIASVVNQTSPEWRLIIFDNRSTDNTYEVIDPFLKDPRVSLVIRETNIGARENNMRALRSIDTEFVATLQADDFLDPTFVELALRQLRNNPTAPFAFANWHHFMCSSKNAVYHDSLPLALHRSGPVRIAPLLTIMNFVPLHMVVFRTACLHSRLQTLEDAHLWQLGEQFLLKLLEDAYGPGCFSGSVGGVWRLHATQMTAANAAASIGVIENAFERLWYASRTPNPHPDNIFLALAAFVMISSHTPYPTAVDWLLTPTGKNLLHSHGLSPEDDLEHYRAMALTVAVKFSAYTSFKHLDRSALGVWLQRMGCADTAQGLRTRLQQVREREGDVFLNDEEIDDVVGYFYRQHAEPNFFGLPEQRTFGAQPLFRHAYHRWASGRAELPPEDRFLIEQNLAQARPDNQPRFCVAIQAATDPGALSRTLASALNQLLAPGRIVVIGCAAPAALVDADRITWIDDDGKENYAQLGLASANDWVLGLVAGDVLSKDALFHLSRRIGTEGLCAPVLYFDHDELDHRGHYCNPHFKPASNPDLLRSAPYIGRAVAVRGDWLVREGFSPPRDIVAAFRIALRAVELHGEAGMAHEPSLIAHLDPRETTMWAASDAQHAALHAALADHVSRIAPRSLILDGPSKGTFHWLPPLSSCPAVSIVVPTHDDAPALKRCIQSLIEGTDYPNLEILIVDNDSRSSEARHFLTSVARLFPDRVRVLPHTGPFDLARMNNAAAQAARGEYLLLLNDDVAALQPDWLKVMMRHGLRDEVGAVGAGLYDPDGRIRHAGVILGLNGPAEHPYLAQAADTSGYLYRAQVQQDYSAVTGACLLIRKSLYLELGGMDEAHLAAAYGDIDLCLRLRDKGKLVVWTPLAMLLHEQGASRHAVPDGTSRNDRDERVRLARTAMFERWSRVIADDPAYNPNLSLQGAAYAIEANPLFANDPLKDLSAGKLLAFLTGDTEDARYRIVQPFAALHQQHVLRGGIVDDVAGAHLVLRSRATTIVLQQPRNPEQLLRMEALVALPGVTKVFDGDDMLYNAPLRDMPAELRPDDLLARMEAVIGRCDRIVVSNARLAARLAHLNDDVRVVPDRLDHGMWGDQPPRRSTRPALRRPRVGWTDRACRAEDIEMIADVVRSLAPEVDWVCIGSCPQSLRPYLAGHIDHVTAPEYPSVLMAQDWDLALAPRHADPADTGLSPIRLAEYGWCGFAVACSDIPPYRNALPTLRVANTVTEWETAIRTALGNLAVTRANGALLQQHVVDAFMLRDEVLQDWYGAWTQPRATPGHTPDAAAGERAQATASPAAPMPRAGAPTGTASMAADAENDTADARPQPHDAGGDVSAEPAAQSSEPDAESYRHWRERRRLGPHEWQFLPPLLPGAAGSPPRFHVIIRATADDADLLAGTVASLEAQTGCGWQLDIFSTAYAPDLRCLNARANVQWHSAASMRDVKAAIDARVASLDHDYVVELPAGARLDPLCLYRVAHAAQANGHASAQVACFVDDDRVDADGSRHSPRFKPSPDPDWIRCMDLLGPIFLGAAAWHEVGGASAGSARPWYDLALRMLDRHGEQAFVHVGEPLLSLPAASSSIEHAATGIAAVRRSLARRRSPGKVVRVAEDVWRTTYPVTATPLVTIAVPSRDKAEYLEQCMTLLLAQTTYPNYEVLIVDGGSVDRETRRLIEELQRRGEAPVRAIRTSAELNLASFGNAAAAEADGELLLLMADDIRVVDPNWLTHLVGHLLRDEVACVSPLIVGPLDGRIESAGIVPGLGGFAASPHQSRARIHDAGYLNMLRVDRAAAALSPHCLLLRTADMRAAGGFDARDLSAAHAELDLCLRLAGERRRCVTTAGTSVVRLGASCLGRLPLTQADMARRQVDQLVAQERVYERWFEAFASDRWWSRHLDRGSCDARLELRCVPSWHARPWTAPRILALPVSNAQGLIRIDQPLNALERAGKAHSCIFRPSADVPGIPLAHDLARHRPDVIIAHLLVGLPSLMTVHQWRRLMPGVRLVYSIDDLFTDMPQKSSLRQGIPADARTYLMRLLEYFDRLVVSTEYLADVYGPYAAETRVVPNRLERDVWMGLRSRRGTGARPRVGWAGGTAHEGDLQLIAEVIAATADEVDWIFMGMCPDNIRPYIREFHPFSDYGSYPARLAALDLDIAVAPLEQIPFNRGKSNLRLLEYGALGIPVVCTDIDPYRNSPACRVRNRSRDWLEALRERVHDPDAATREGEAMRRWVVDHFIVEDHLDSWLDAHMPRMTTHAGRRGA